MTQPLTLTEMRVLTGLLSERQLESIEALRLGSWVLIDGNGWLIGTFKTMSAALGHISTMYSDDTRVSLDKIAQGHYWAEEYISRLGKPREIVRSYEIKQISINNFVEVKGVVLSSLLPGAFDYHHPLWELRKNLRCGLISEKEALETAKELLVEPKAKALPPEEWDKSILQIRTADAAEKFVASITCPLFIPVEKGLFLCLEPGKFPTLTESADSAASRIPLPFFATSAETVVFKYRRYINKFLGHAARNS